MLKKQSKIAGSKTKKEKGATPSLYKTNKKKTISYKTGMD